MYELGVPAPGGLSVRARRTDTSGTPLQSKGVAMRKTRITLVAAIATAALAGLTAGNAAAACSGVCVGDQQVTGTPLSVLSLGVTTPLVPLGPLFGPGQTSSGTGAMLVSSTQAWTLQVQDNSNTGANNGHLAKGGALCPATAESTTTNALAVTSAGTIGGLLAAGGTVSSGLKTLSNAAQTVAQGSVTDTITNTYGITVGAGEQMGTGCTYSTTATYTVQ